MLLVLCSYCYCCCGSDSGSGTQCSTQCITQRHSLSTHRFSAVLSAAAMSMRCCEALRLIRQVSAMRYTLCPAVHGKEEHVEA
jgi:hypothetical protein